MSLLNPRTIRVDVRGRLAKSPTRSLVGSASVLPEITEGDHVIAFVSEPAACSGAEARFLRRIADAAKTAGARFTMYPPAGRPMVVVGQA